MDIYAGSYCVIFGFGHQGAELLSAKGEKMGVLAIFGGFPHKSCPISGSLGMKLAGSGLWAYTQGFYVLFWNLAIRGLSY